MVDITITMIALLVGVLAVCGGLQAAIPYMMSSRELFAVTVPLIAHTEPEVRRMKRTYALAVVLLTLVGIAAVVACGIAAGWGDAAAWVMVGAVLLQTVVSFALMLHFRAKVRALKRKRGWQAVSSERVSVTDNPDGSPLPRPVPLTAELVCLPLIALTVVLGFALYPQMPEQVPMHMDLAGNVNSYADKSLWLVASSPLLQLFVWLCVAGAHLSIVRSSRPVSPEAPHASALGYALFTRAWSRFTLAMNILLMIAFGTFPLCMAGWMSLGAWAIALTVLVVVTLVWSVVLFVRYGQNGSRAVPAVHKEDEMRADEDAHWKAGVFYWNPDDPAVFVAKRFSVGWTMNFARPASWLFILGLCALIVLVILLSMRLA